MPIDTSRDLFSAVTPMNNWLGKEPRLEPELPGPKVIPTPPGQAKPPAAFESPVFPWEARAPGMPRPARQLAVTHPASLPVEAPILHLSLHSLCVTVVMNH